MPTISVIVPIYNVELFLKRCVDSILKQTFTDYELILVDDGSPDKCPEICEKIKEKDERVIVIHKKNGGLSDARNAGIKIAKGEFITFVDSDDVISPNALEILYQVYLQTKSDIVIADRYAKFNQDIQCEMSNVENVKILDPNRALEYIFTVSFRWEAWGTLYKKKLFENEKFPIGKLYEDMALIPILILKAKKITFVNTIIYYYFQRESSIMGNSRVSVKVDLIEICDMLCEKISQQVYNNSSKNNIIAGIMLELASRIQIASKKESLNDLFIKLGRKCLRENTRSIVFSKLAFTKKIYCLGYAYHFDKFYIIIYGMLKNK